MYRVIIERRATKEATAIPKEQMSRIAGAIRGLASNPFPEGFRKIIGESGVYRIREGDYRVLYMIDEKANEVRILKIAHRKDIYR